MVARCQEESAVMVENYKGECILTKLYLPTTLRWTSCLLSATTTSQPLTPLHTQALCNFHLLPESMALSTLHSSQTHTQALCNFHLLP
mgnify:CR=1 FL=1